MKMDCVTHFRNDTGCLVKKGLGEWKRVRNQKPSLSPVTREGHVLLYLYLLY